MDILKYRLQTLSLPNIIIAVNLVIFLIAQVFVFTEASFLAGLLLGAESVRLVLSGEVWRIVTSGFLHLNFLHFAFNMYALWMLGGFVEKFYSRSKFWLVYSAAIIGGSILSLGVSILTQPNVDIFSLGASGGIFGLLGLLVGTSFLNKLGPELPIDRNQLLFIAGINLFFGFAVPGINNAAHIGGLLVGILFSKFVLPYSDIYTVPALRSAIYNSSIFLAIITVLCLLLQLLYAGNLLLFTL